MLRHWVRGLLGQVLCAAAWLQVVGIHDGYWFYTVGQRGGIKLPGGPW